MRKLKLLFINLLVLLFSQVSLTAQPQSWVGGTLTNTVTGPIDDGVGGSITYYTNWIYTDPQGVAHHFIGETERAKIEFLPGKFHFQNTNFETVSTDGIYAVQANGPTGLVGLQVAAYPKYQILSVLYAPPGSKSSASYSNQSTLGTTTSISNSFGQTSGLSVDLGVNIGVTGFGGTFSSSWTETKVSTTEIGLQKTETNGMSIPGPLSAEAGIDHDFDIIYIWLNPQINLRAYNSTSTKWAASNDPRDPASNNGAYSDVIPLYVIWLKNPNTMPSNVISRLQRTWAGFGMGLNTSDYNKILQRDPFANGQTYIDPSRFVSLPAQTFPYLPPPSGGQPLTTTFNFSKTSSVKTTNSFTDEYTSSYSFNGKINMLLNGSIKSTNSWTTKNTNTLSNSSSATQSASVSITGPPYGYTGSTNVLVYWDSVYNTFLFAFGQ